MDVKPLLLLWQVEIKPAGSWVQQLSTDLNNFSFLKVLGTLCSGVPGGEKCVQGLSWAPMSVTWWEQDRASGAHQEVRLGEVQLNLERDRTSLLYLLFHPIKSHCRSIADKLHCWLVAS